MFDKQQKEKSEFWNRKRREEKKKKNELYENWSKRFSPAASIIPNWWFLVLILRSLVSFNVTSTNANDIKIATSFQKWK